MSKLPFFLFEHLLFYEVVDLLQGRIGESVFLRYYYEPFLKPIKEKVLTAIQPLADKLLKALN